MIATVVLLGVFRNVRRSTSSTGSRRARPQVEAENEIDDIEQMIAAQNELRRRRGKPERTLEEIEAEWRAS